MKTNYTFSLGVDDFLVYTLYNASVSRILQRRRIRMRWFVFVIYTLLGAWLLLSDRVWIGGLVFIVFGVLWLLFYPRYSAFRYKKIYRRIVEEQTRSRIHKPYEMQLHEEYLFMRNATSESKVAYDGIEELLLLPQHYLLLLKEKSGLVVPRTAISESEEFERFFTGKKVPFRAMEGWKWK